MDKILDESTLREIGNQFEKKSYKSRLAETLTGVPLEDVDKLIEKVKDDRKKLESEFKLPPIELRRHNPKEYRVELIRRINEEGLRLISFDEVPAHVLEKDWWIRTTMKNATPKSGFTREDVDFIAIGDKLSEDPAVLKVIAHELIHAIDYKRKRINGEKGLPIEQLEYRAYLLADISERSLDTENGAQTMRTLFGDFMISGSCLGYYLSLSIETGESADYSDFMKKLNAGEINIPWYSNKTI